MIDLTERELRAESADVTVPEVSASDDSTFKVKPGTTAFINKGIELVLRQ